MWTLSESNVQNCHLQQQWKTPAKFVFWSSLHEGRTHAPRSHDATILINISEQNVIRKSCHAYIVLKCNFITILFHFGVNLSLLFAGIWLLFLHLQWVFVAGKNTSKSEQSVNVIARNFLKHVSRAAKQRRLCVCALLRRLLHSHIYIYICMIVNSSVVQ